MSVRLCNEWLDALISALQAEKDHEQALAALIAAHGGKRSLPLMEALQAGFCVIYPATPGEVRVYRGQPTVSFPRGCAAERCWSRKITPHLPKIQAGRRTKKATDPVATWAKRAKREFSAAQLRRLVALLAE